MSGTFERIWDLARQCPPGKVVTYGQLARLAGSPRGARVAGFAMHACPPDVPWHRVVNREGRPCPCDTEPLQRSLLAAEGVPFTLEGNVDLSKCAWLGEPADLTK